MNYEQPKISVRDECRSVQADLALVDRRASLRQIRQWTRGQRKEASAWAWQQHLRAADNNVRVPPIPPHVEALPRFGGAA